MRKELLLTYLILFVSSVFAKYDESLAKDMVYVSALAYCPADRILSGDCGKATTKTTELGIEVLHAMDNGLDLNGITYTILKNSKAKTLYVGFSGTRDPEQLITEVAEAFPVKYGIHPEVDGAKVFDYFYSHYLNGFRDDFNTQMAGFLKTYSNYNVIFTGHSLGGAMTVHACADFMLNGMGKNRKVYVYTYGQPRVSNPELIDAFVGDLAGFFRVDHHRDIVPHIPPCITDLHHSCVHDGILPFYPYHSAQEIWYNSDFSSFTYCSTTNGEDPECSDKEINESIPDHLTYFGVEVGGYHSQLPSILKSA